MTRLSRAIRAFVAPRPIRRSWDAAGGGPRWQANTTIAAPVTQGIAAAGAILPRARAATENNPLARAAVETLAAALVGHGVKPTSPRDASLAERFETWTDAADVTGLCDFYGLQALMATAMVRDGESFALMSVNADDRLALRVIAAEQVDRSLHRDLGDGRRIVAGVEMDGEGRRVAYHILPDSPDLPFAVLLTPRRVPAEDVIHVFRPTYAGQVRGVSWLAPVLTVLAELDKAMDAQVIRQQIAAALTGFIHDQEGGTGGFEGTPRDGVLDGGLEPGTIKVLGPGQDIRFSTPASIGEDAISFLRLVHRIVASGIGCTYEQISGDYGATNYSSSRASLIEFRRKIEAVQHHVLVRQLCRPVWRRWLALEALSGRIAADGLARDPDAFLAAKWITPGWAWVDPSKEIDAEIKAIDAGLKSRREVVAGRGYDIAQLDREIAEDAARRPARPEPTP